VKNTFGG